ncbi:MAG: type VI secretion system amidase effector protein Tae4 [Candidatus Symbiothrix sp.]|jgi:hypothetical protein|nr:type VI secretion system amidase effector protein Tae4 [Candidatus Symbiothrix sp.]
MAITYATLSTAFADIKGKSVAEVGRMIGGKVKINIDAGIFTNACAIRFSYAINKAEISITAKDGKVSSGADGKKYLYRIGDVEKFVKNKMLYTKVLSGDNSSDFEGEHGVIVFKDCGWNDASGHIDLYDGTKVEGHDYSLVCGKVILYVLP